jgi:hypothetical protein
MGTATGAAEGMVGRQGVAAPVSSRFWDTCALYVSKVSSSTLACQDVQ